MLLLINECVLIDIFNRQIDYQQFTFWDIVIILATFELVRLCKKYYL